ncbi:hypothetical protein CDAR_564491 [Caerostris darwini]|uniref:Uncharacterized protein n=1 Tax=Caerostris darwini TaxID=1538125 RepID=A0AAV4TL97_9ARAC|nr:hypothetical protein CDAR_564491 [Caerostris darwini]
MKKAHELNPYSYSIRGTFFFGKGLITFFSFERKYCFKIFSSGSYLQIKEASFGDKETDVRRNGRQNGERLFALMPGVQSVPIRSVDWKMLTPEWAGRVELRCFSPSSPLKIPSL